MNVWLITQAWVFKITVSSPKIPSNPDEDYPSDAHFLTILFCEATHTLHDHGIYLSLPQNNHQDMPSAHLRHNSPPTIPSKTFQNI